MRSSKSSSKIVRVTLAINQKNVGNEGDTYSTDSDSELNADWSKQIASEIPKGQIMPTITSSNRVLYIEIPYQSASIVNNIFLTFLSPAPWYPNIGVGNFILCSFQMLW